MPAKPAPLRMPNASRGMPRVSEIAHTGQVVVVGANGSGKTRLGAWLENPASLRMNRSGVGNHQRMAYRIGSQRSLALPEQAQRVDPARVVEQLVKGSEGPGSDLSRVQGDPVVGQHNDFSLLVNSLFAQRARLEREYREKGLRTGGNPGLPDPDTLQKLTELWDRIFSERSLDIGDHAVRAKPTADGSATYAGSALSDGERVGFYLIGHALLAPTGALIVIDEPELHLHESIQSTLWDEVVSAREDCSFVFITHDLGFAASRVEAVKVVLYDYVAPSRDDEVGTWDWDVVPPTLHFPEDIVLRIMGSRRPVVFVEGTVGSRDQLVYEALMPDRYVVPSNSCDAVDRAVRAFQDQAALHHHSVAGLIDLDDRLDDEVSGLAQKGIFALPVGSVEGLLGLSECIYAYALSIKLKPGDAEARASDAKRRVVDAMKKVRDEAVADRALYSVRRRISLVQRTGPSKQDLVDSVADALKTADPATAHDSAAGAIDSALNAATPEQAYEGVLKVFRNKAIIAQIGAAFGITADEYANAVVALFRSDPMLRALVRKRLPNP